MTQLIPFDTSKGGNIPNLCLANVCKGYNIANKYGSAWEAWEHTQQHPDRNIPSGLAVPIYYSYTTTIDGVTQNYGHINVQLPNGTVWSDGNIYQSIDDYTSKKLPTFVGWGESVNDAKIIQEGNDMTLPTKQQVADAYMTHNLDTNGKATSATQADQDYYSTQDVSVLYSVLLDHETDNVHKIVNQNQAGATVLKPGKYLVN